MDFFWIHNPTSISPCLEKSRALSPLALPWTHFLACPMLVLHCSLIQSAWGHITCGKVGRYTPAPAITLKGNQGDRQGDTLLKALQLKPLVPSSKLHLLPKKTVDIHSSPAAPRCQQHSLVLMTEAPWEGRVLSFWELSGNPESQ